MCCYGSLITLSVLVIIFFFDVRAKCQLVLCSNNTLPKAYFVQLLFILVNWAPRGNGYICGCSFRFRNCMLYRYPAHYLDWPSQPTTVVHQTPLGTFQLFWIFSSYFIWQRFHIYISPSSCCFGRSLLSLVLTSPYHATAVPLMFGVGYWRSRAVPGLCSSLKKERDGKKKGLMIENALSLTDTS